jgi:hypothetical protein
MVNFQDVFQIQKTSRSRFLHIHVYVSGGVRRFYPPPIFTYTCKWWRAPLLPPIFKIFKFQSADDATSDGTHWTQSRGGGGGPVPHQCIVLRTVITYIEKVRHQRKHNLNQLICALYAPVTHPRTDCAQRCLASTPESNALTVRP